MSIKIDGIELHESVTVDRVIEAVKESTFGLEDIGICIRCGEERGGCEPDARRYPCEDCGKRTVYGAQEILLHLEA